MSVGSVGNKSHPQDAFNAWLYTTFNEPVRTFSWIQLAALVTFVCFCVFATVQRTQAMIHILFADILTTTVCI